MADDADPFAEVAERMTAACAEAERAVADFQRKLAVVLSGYEAVALTFQEQADALIAENRERLEGENHAARH